MIGRCNSIAELNTKQFLQERRFQQAVAFPRWRIQDTARYSIWFTAPISYGVGATQGKQPQMVYLSGIPITLCSQYLRLFQVDGHFEAGTRTASHHRGDPDFIRRVYSVSLYICNTYVTHM